MDDSWHKKGHPWTCVLEKTNMHWEHNEQSEDLNASTLCLSSGWCTKSYSGSWQNKPISQKWPDDNMLWCFNGFSY